MDHCQGLDPGHHRELASYVDRRIGADRLRRVLGPRTGGWHHPTLKASQEVPHVLVAGVQNHDVVVVLQLADRDQLTLGAVPGILVVQHHRPAAQCLELGHLLVAVHDLVEVVDREVRVIAR